MRWGLALILMLAMIAVALAQATGVNPPVGSVWTYLGATYGAGWAPGVQPGDARTFGADPTGASDSTAALQNWGNWVCAQANRKGYLPAGTYKFTAAISWTGCNHDSFVGDGQAATQLIYAGAATNLNLVTLSYSLETTVQGWQVNSTTTMTGGVGVHIFNVNYSDFIDFAAGGASHNNTGQPLPTPTLYNGILFDNIAYDTLVTSRPYALHDAIQIVQGAGLTIDNTSIQIKTGNSGVHLEGGFGGLYLQHVEVECNNVGLNGLIIDNTGTAAGNSQIFISDSAIFDSCANDNIYVNDTSTSSPNIKTIQMGGWASAAQNVGKAGMHIAAWNNGLVKIAGSAQMFANQGSGLQIDDTTTFVTIDPAATLTGNGGYGVTCTNPMTIQTGAQSTGPFGNIQGNYSPACSSTVPFTPVASCGGSGTPPTLSNGGSNYYLYGQRAYVHLAATFTSTGTCTGSLKLSLPSTLPLLGGCVFKGMELANHVAIVGFAEGTPNDVTIQKYDGTLMQTNTWQFFHEGQCATSG